ncbi:MAG TPA: YggT family protein [Eubacteriaceae bacterium]|jgi:YggT family protein|nr:YggT family protein [Eubacteriaceae bacterium]
MSNALIRIGSAFFEFINIMIIVNVLLKFLSTNTKSRFYNFIASMTEPILEPLRKFAMFDTVDFSPFVAILVIEYVILPVYIALVIKLLG